MDPGSSGDLHFQLFAFGGVRRHGIAVVGPEATLTLRPHRLCLLVGCVRAGAPATQACVLRYGKDTRINGMVTSHWQQVKWSNSSCVHSGTFRCISNTARNLVFFSHSIKKKKRLLMRRFIVVIHSTFGQGFICWNYSFR